MIVMVLAPTMNAVIIAQVCLYLKKIINFQCFILSKVNFHKNKKFLLVSSFQTQGWYGYFSKALMVSNKRAMWSVARECCQKKHLKCDLASIESTDEMNFISPNMVSESAWIGAEKKNNIWSWSDGTTWNYQNWDTGKPNLNLETSQVAVRLSSSGKWHDSKKNVIYKFVCQCADENWIYFYHTNKYYKIFWDARTWDKGRNSCQQECDNGDLASIPDQTTTEFINLNMGGDNVWIGAEYKSGAWSWSDGTNWIYTNWNTGLDLGQSGFGVELSYGKWKNIDKSTSKNFICQCPK